MDFRSDPFLWMADSEAVSLGSLGGSDPFFVGGAAAVSRDGRTVVGTSFGPAGQEAFLWNAVDGMIGLGELPGGTLYSVANDVSGDGRTVVGVSIDSSSYMAFIWDQIHGMRRVVDLLTEAGIDMSGWHLAAATGISADGRVIVGYGSNPFRPNSTEAWLVDLGPLPVPEPTAMVICAGLALCGAACVRRAT